MMRIMVVAGTRPECVKLFPLIAALREQPDVDMRFCVSGQHRQMLDQALALCDLTPDVDLGVMREGQSLDALTARLLTGLGEAYDAFLPDRVVVQGDTVTAMAATLAAHYRQIPVAHVEAGLRTGDIANPWPEEANRRIIACMADLHFAPTEGAAQALLAENHDPARVFVTGNTGVDALRLIRARMQARPEMAAGLDPLLHAFAGRRILTVTCHRRENLGAPIKQIATALYEIAQRPDVAIVMPLHANQAIRPMLAQLEALPNVALIDALDHAHFLRLLDSSALVLTDSGGVQEEAPAFGKPVLVLRETTERPEGVAAGTAIVVGTDVKLIVDQATRLLDDGAAYAQMARMHGVYGDGRSAGRIVKLIVAHTALRRPQPWMVCPQEFLSSFRTVKRHIST